MKSKNPKKTKKDIAVTIDIHPKDEPPIHLEIEEGSNQQYLFLYGEFKKDESGEIKLPKWRYPARGNPIGLSVLWLKFLDENEEIAKEFLKLLFKGLTHKEANSREK